MDVDNMVYSDEAESREVVVTSAERRDPTATSAGEEHEATRRAMVPTPRKRAASADAVGRRAAKRTRSPRPSAVSLVPSSPATDVAERAERSEERSGAHAATGLVPTPDLQPEEALPVVAAIEQSERSEAETGAWSIRDLQSEDAPPAASVRESRVGGRSDP